MTFAIFRNFRTDLSGNLGFNQDMKLVIICPKFSQLKILLKDSDFQCADKIKQQKSL